MTLENNNVKLSLLYTLFSSHFTFNLNGRIFFFSFLLPKQLNNADSQTCK